MLKCSFCKHPQTAVAALLHSGDVCICNECVDAAANELLEKGLPLPLFNKKVAAIYRASLECHKEMVLGGTVTGRIQCETPNESASPQAELAEELRAEMARFKDEQKQFQDREAEDALNKTYGYPFRDRGGRG